MKEEKTNKKKVLTDEELQEVSGGVSLQGDFNVSVSMKVCEDITDQTECNSSEKCVWVTNRCKAKTVSVF